jgi:site-specific DNA recombinase
LCYRSQPLIGDNRHFLHFYSRNTMLRRMGKAYIDGVFPDEEYHRQKKILEMELESLVIPQADAAENAGKLVMALPWL